MDQAPRITTDLTEVIVELKKGNLVAVPTETVYGLAADATQVVAVSKVFKLKGRPIDHPLIVHCGSAEYAWKCVTGVNATAESLASAFWPGALTMVLNRSDLISDVITAGQDSVAVRVPDHPLTLQLLKELQRPLVAPSANRFGRVSPTQADHVQEEFPNQSLLILDGGPCKIGIESTIVDCRQADSVKILRPGKITEEQIKQVLNFGHTINDTTNSDDLRVSGNLPAHYAPSARVHLASKNDLVEFLEHHGFDHGPVMVISTSDKPLHLKNNIVWQRVSSQPEEFAQKLYALFREADRQGFPYLVVELPVREGLGIAICDRLQRAAHSSNIN